MISGSCVAVWRRIRNDGFGTLRTCGSKLKIRRLLRLPAAGVRQPYDVASDGQRCLLNIPVDQASDAYQNVDPAVTDGISRPSGGAPR